MVADGPGRWTVSYERFVATAGIASRRVFTETVTLNSPNGSPCTDGATCTSGLCTDGVCCDLPCGAGDTSDCQACSVASGALRDGACGPVGAGVTCRSALSSCDVAEACDGMALTCPPDRMKPNGTGCLADAGLCQAGLCVSIDGGILGSDGGTRPAQHLSTTCGEHLDFQPMLNVGAGATFAAESFDGKALPLTLKVDPMTGELQFDAQQQGHTSLILSGRGPTGTDFVQVEIDAQCEPLSRTVGCGCGSGGPLFALAVLGLAAARRLRRGR
jgi:hypothetical protein